MFFFNDTATTEIYTLSLHDALPICVGQFHVVDHRRPAEEGRPLEPRDEAAGDDVLEVLPLGDRKSTRLNSSHANISYAVFCLKKKKINPFSYCHTIHL